MFDFLQIFGKRHFYIDEGPYLPSLEHLVEHYQKFSDGLPTELKFPVKPPELPLINYSTIPRQQKSLVAVQPASFSNLSPSECSSGQANLNRSYTKEKQKTEKSPVKNIILEGFRSLRKPKSSSHSTTFPIVPSPETEVALSPLNNLQFKSDFQINEPYQTPRNRIDSTHYSETDTSIAADVNNSSSFYQNLAVTFIPKEKLIFKDQLGRGEFGCVFRGQYLYRNQYIEVAIKTLHSEHSDADQKSFLEEAELMMNLHHPCIVRLIGVCNVSFLLFKEIIPLSFFM